MSETVSMTDNRNGKTYEMPVAEGAITAKMLQKVRLDQSDSGLISYDPGYQNTAPATSSITYIDGKAGTLLYRGYPIEELARGCKFLEVAYLLVNGELPRRPELNRWRTEILAHRTLDDPMLRLIGAFPRDAHPMGMLISAVGALGTLYPDAKQVQDPAVRQRQIFRILGAMPAITAHIYAHGQGMRVATPDAEMGYVSGFLRMVRQFGLDSLDVNPVIEQAMNALLVLHADHEQNCSTTVMRSIGSSHADPYSAMAGAVAALYGPLHGGANEAVLNMLDGIGTVANIPDFLQKVMNRETLLMGFGHRVYKNLDPRAKLIKELAYQVFEVTGPNPSIELAIELERSALDMAFFRDRNLYPNVDFYSGIIYQALGIPPQFYTVLFALARTVGWLAHWVEHLEDSTQKIARPKQIYKGPDHRAVVPMDQR